MFRNFSAFVLALTTSAVAVLPFIFVAMDPDTTRHKINYDGWPVTASVNIKKKTIQFYSGTAVWTTLQGGEGKITKTITTWGGRYPNI